MKTILTILLAASVAWGQEHNTLLIVGNSRAAASIFPDSAIAADLGCSQYINLAVGGYKVADILATLNPGITQAADSLRAILFMDVTNNSNGFTTYTTTYRETDSLIRRALEVVSADSFYFCQNGPNTNALAINDSAVVTTALSRGTRAKTGYLQNMEYELAAKYHFKFAGIYDYFCKNSVDSADYADITFAPDGTHYNEAGYNVIRNAIANATHKTSKSIMWGNSRDGSWKTWTMKGAAVIAGDTNTGSVTLSAGDSIVSPVKCLGWNTKNVTITPYDTGTVSIYVRYSDSYFKRNDATLAWLPYTAISTTDKNFCQFMLVATTDALIDSCNFTWRNFKNTGNHLKQFGNRQGMIREWHKDASIYRNQGRSYGGQVSTVHNTLGNYMSVIRYGTDYDIPEDAVIDSAKLHLFVYQATAQQIRVQIRPMLTDFGVMRYWDEYEENQTATPSQSQATFYYAMATTKRWLTTGDTIGVSDYGARTDTIVKPAGATVGTEIIVNVTNTVTLSVADTAHYYGWGLNGYYSSGADNFASFYSQNEANPSLRPYLEVWFKTHKANSTGNNKPSIAINLGL